MSTPHEAMRDYYREMVTTQLYKKYGGTVARSVRGRSMVLCSKCRKALTDGPNVPLTYKQDAGQAFLSMVPTKVCFSCHWSVYDDTAITRAMRALAEKMGVAT